jgi:hypothetical protein
MITNHTEVTKGMEEENANLSSEVAHEKLKMSAIRERSTASEEELRLLILERTKLEHAQATLVTFQDTAHGELKTKFDTLQKEYDSKEVELETAKDENTFQSRMDKAKIQSLTEQLKKRSHDLDLAEQRSQRKQDRYEDTTDDYVRENRKQSERIKEMEIEGGHKDQALQHRERRVKELTELCKELRKHASSEIGHYEAHIEDFHDAHYTDEVLEREDPWTTVGGGSSSGAAAPQAPEAAAPKAPAVRNARDSGLRPFQKR